MFERYLSDIVANHFGGIIQNHTFSEVSVSSGGHLVLRDVELQTTALQHVLGNNKKALEIRYGKIGQLDVQIPWKVLRGFFLGSSSSNAAMEVSIHVRDVHIWLAPPTTTSTTSNDTTPTDTNTTETTPDESDDFDSNLLREQAVQTALDARVVLLKDSHSKNNNSWKLRLLRSLITNLSVTLHNIHVRYEDASGLALGLTLAELVAQQQQATISQCAIYWRDAYLLEPLSGTLDWRDPMNVKAVLPVCRLAVSRSMLQDIGYLRKRVAAWCKEDPTDTTTEGVLERPQVSPKEDPRGWWRYAVSAVSIPRSNVGWKSLILGLRKRKAYQKLFRAFVQAETAEARVLYHNELLELERVLLSVEEIVAFRWWAYNELRDVKVKPIPATMKSKRSKSDDTTNEVDEQDEEQVPSPASRLQSFQEIAGALSRTEKSSATEDENKTDDSQEQLLWQTRLQCNELSLQVSDSHVSLDRTILSVPIVSLSCAIDYHHEIFADGSWKVVNRIGSLVVKDCTGSTRWFRNAGSQFDVGGVNLLGPKGGDTWKDRPEEIFLLDEQPFHQSIWLQVRRTKKWSVTGDFEGSTTATKVRVLPLEFLYSPTAIESVTHIIETASSELAEDYDQISNRVSVWRRNQQKRLWRALAHKEKKLLIDVVVGSPVMLFPEGNDPDTPMLVVDLGELRFSDDSAGKVSSETTFDDKWKLEVRSIEVRRSTTRLYVHPDLVDRNVFHRIVEPFSLSVSIWTKVEGDEAVSKDKTSVLVHATLPRLYVNLTSSALQVFFRLQSQWNELKKERKGRLPVTDAVKVDANSGERKIEFHFSAPLLGGRLADDRSGSDDPRQIFSMELKGISGTSKATTTPELGSTAFSLKVHTLAVRDTYQSAGTDFSLLFSSVAPEFMSPSRSFESPRLADHQHSDLVSVEYELRRQLVRCVQGDEGSKVQDDREVIGVNTLSIKFNELYVNWNPETIAAVSRSLLVSPTEEPLYDTDSFHDSITTIDDQFFDAPEDAFFDALAEESGRGDFDVSGNSSFRAILSVFSSQHEQATKLAEHDEAPATEYLVWNSKPMEVVFGLSKLKVGFNKEARHRKLVTCEMDNTTVRFESMRSGGSRTFFQIGNLTLSDCGFGGHKTLYREILGLKTDSRFASDATSLLEMEMIVNPRVPRKISSLSGVEDDPLTHVGSPVTVDLTEGIVHGFDTYFSARFSPMRFVFLQQLWFEVVDYFFCGVIGNEVWGGETPQPGDCSILNGKGIDAEQISFTRFDVKMDCPVILLPVSSCSTDFIRLESLSVSLHNSYSYDSLRPSSLFFVEDGDSGQWFNNCVVEVNSMAFHNWSGKLISSDNPSVRLKLNWPTGPSAVVNTPKWKVDCVFDEIESMLGQQDYALFQHIVNHNIGEVSRHMDEWKVLQALDSNELQRYQSSVFVPFGYDDKGVAPSTYDVSVKIPRVTFTLKEDSEDIAQVRCNDILWTYTKLRDRISVQRVSCNPSIHEPTAGAPMLSHQPLGAEDHERLTYVSTTEPSGSNEKTLTLTRLIFEVHVSAWKRLSTFFSGMQPPTFLSPEEAIQVGDRWYRIGTPQIDGQSHGAIYPWLDGYGVHSASDALSIIATGESCRYGFTLSMISPKVKVESHQGYETILFLSTDRLDFSHDSNGELVKRRLESDGIKASLRRQLSSSTLVSPFHLIAEYNGCNGARCCCVSHDTRVKIGTIEANGSCSNIVDVVRLLASVNDDYDELQRFGSSSSFSLESHESFETAHEEPQLPRLRNMSLHLESMAVDLGYDGLHGFSEVGCLEIGPTSLNSAASEPSHEQFHEYKMTLRVRCIKLHNKTSRTELLAISAEDEDGIICQSKKEDDATHYSSSVALISLCFYSAQGSRCLEFVGRISQALQDVTAQSTRISPRSGFDMSTNLSLQQQTGEVVLAGLSCNIGNREDGGFVASILLSESKMRFEQSLLLNKFDAVVGTITVKNISRDGINGDHTTMFVCENKSKCAEIMYLQFRDGRSSNQVQDDDSVPRWIRAELMRKNRVDDILVVNVLPTTTTFNRAQVDELIGCFHSLSSTQYRDRETYGDASYPNQRPTSNRFTHLTIQHQTLFIPDHHASLAYLALEIGLTVANLTARKSKSDDFSMASCKILSESFWTTLHTDAAHPKSVRIVEAPKLSLVSRSASDSSSVDARLAEGLRLNVAASNLPVLLSIFQNTVKNETETQSSTIGVEEANDDDDETAATTVLTPTTIKVFVSSVCSTFELSSRSLIDHSEPSRIVIHCNDLALESSGYNFTNDVCSLGLEETTVIHVPSYNPSQNDIVGSSTILLEVRNNELVGQQGVLMTCENQTLPSYQLNVSVVINGLLLCFLVEPLSEIKECMDAVQQLVEKRVSPDTTRSPPVELFIQPIHGSLTLSKFKIVYGNKSSATSLEGLASGAGSCNPIDGQTFGNAVSASCDFQKVVIRFVEKTRQVCGLRRRHQHIMELALSSLLESHLPHDLVDAENVGASISPPLSFTFDLKLVGLLAQPSKRSVAIFVEPFALCLSLAELESMLRVQQAISAQSRNTPIDPNVTASESVGENLEEDVEVVFSGAIATLVDQDSLVFRGNLNRSKLSCSRIVDQEGTTIQGNASVSSGLEYHSSRSWNWEPIVEPCSVQVSLLWHESRGGGKELSIEMSDDGSPLCFNMTDALVAKLSSTLNTREKRSLLFSESSISPPNGIVEFAALLQSSPDERTMKPYVFQNRCGFPVSFARQTQARQIQPRPAFSMESEDNTSATNVPHGSDVVFRMEAQLGDPSATTSRFPETPDTLPRLSITLGNSEGFSMHQHGLDIMRTSERLLPLPDSKRRGHPTSRRDWITWTVEQGHEMNTLTVGTCIRVVSLVENKVELGVHEVTRSRATISSIGRMGLGECIHMPVWIGMKRSTWICYARITQEDPFAPAFVIEPDGTVVVMDRLASDNTRYSAIDTHELLFSITKQETDGITTIFVDAIASLRNMLPTSIDWEIRDDTLEETLDGSSSRRATLASGGFVDVMRNSKVMSFRVRPCIPGLRWSCWHAFGSLSNGEPDNEEFEEHIDVRDTLNILLPFGYRVSRKQNGLDVCVYAEVWCSNGTALNLVFGTQPSNSEAEATRHEFSAAEATLKEIASLFESGDGATGLRRELGTTRERDRSFGVTRLPGQVGSRIIEEIYEYVEVQRSTVTRQWWASNDPFDPKPDISSLGGAWDWVDDSWMFEAKAKSDDGWESSHSLSDFQVGLSFKAGHRYRRRRWFRTRNGNDSRHMVAGVSAFLHPEHLDIGGNRPKKTEETNIRIGIQAEGGGWSKTPFIPTSGVAYGVIKASGQRPSSCSPTANNPVYELCYCLSPMEGEWGAFSRSMFVTSRYLVRNDSDSVAFVIKQAGADDASSLTVLPGQTCPFHWDSSTLPNLLCLRPVSESSRYEWSGMFDPLLIGSTPLRTRYQGDTGGTRLRSVKVDVDIRPGTGKTGINISLKEESSNGNGASYRVENCSPMPVWAVQDIPTERSPICSDLIAPYASLSFALDDPQATRTKRNHSMRDLLGVRLSLAPQESPAGNDTARTISLDSEGEAVLLFPSELSFLGSDLRAELQGLAVAGTIKNDGPTRVLMLRLIRTANKTRIIQKRVDWVSRQDKLLYPFMRDIELGAQRATNVIKSNTGQSMDLGSERDIDKSSDAQRNLAVSFRAALTGVRVSFVDSTPSEIFLASLANVNAIGSFDLLRRSDATFYLTVSGLQVDNMVPNAPFLVAVSRFESSRSIERAEDTEEEAKSPLLVVGLSVAPRHESGVVCIKSATIMPRNLFIRIDIASLVRAQKFVLDLQQHFQKKDGPTDGKIHAPDMVASLSSLDAAASAGRGNQKYHFGCLTVLPINIRLSFASARALSNVQAVLCGPEVAAIHQAVRKGDLMLRAKKEGIVGVKIGSRNKTPRMVIEGMLKSVLFDGLLRLDGASLNFGGVTLVNHTTSLPQLVTAITAHYVTCLRQNVPMLLGSMAAIGNPLGLVRGLGEGVGEFVLEPFRGFQRSVQEMDPSHLVDGVARGTLSLARHTVGGFADSAALLAETFSKNMTVLTLDRRYAIKRDRGAVLRDKEDLNVASGLGSGAQKLVIGFLDGVTGVVRAPIRGAEKSGFEGFAKGIGKGVLGLLVKPMIGISDGFTDVMMGVKGTVDGASGSSSHITPVRPCRALYGRDKLIRPYNFADSAASALMMRTRLAGELYLSHLDMVDRVALMSTKRFVILGRRGEELLVLKLKHIEKVETRDICHENESEGWGVIVVLNTPRQNGSEVEVIMCKEMSQASELSRQLLNGKDVSSMEEL